MRKLDRILMQWRISKAVPFVRRGDRLLDVGCFDGCLIRRVQDRVAGAVGMDPLATPREDGRCRIIRGVFPDSHPFADAEFDCITLLAVLEHLPDPNAFAAECFRVLKPAGRVVVTVPSPMVDRILDVLSRLRLIDGMSLEEHHGFDVRRTTDIFRRAGFELEMKGHFQLGLNNLFVFSKPRMCMPAPASPTPAMVAELASASVII